MHNFQLTFRFVVTAFVSVFLVLAFGCSKSVDDDPTKANQMGVTAQSASKLGDLAIFRSIAVDVADLVNKDNLSSAETRIKDLELAWDSAEAGLKPRSADDWHRLDKAIDNALKALRSDRPNKADCKRAMETLLKTFDSLEGKT